MKNGDILFISIGRHEYLQILIDISAKSEYFIKIPITFHNTSPLYGSSPVLFEPCLPTGRGRQESKDSSIILLSLILILH